MTNPLKELRFLRFFRSVILANNNKYIVKIYTKKSKNLIMLIKIINYFISYKNIPTTIYKSYYLTEKKNSLKPEYFSYNINKYNSKYLLFEVMKTYKITLKDFVYTINNNNNRINILISLFYQGLYTFLWLYIKKGIVHLDINSDNFFVEKTMSEEFIVEIKNIEFKIPTAGYNLVISDFGFAKSIEFMDYDNYKYRYDIRVNLESFDIHPHQDIINFIKLFKKYFSKYNVNLNDLDININNVNIHMINRTQTRL